MRRLRSDVTFQSCGLTCRGWLFAPENASNDQKHPVIIMAHGFSGVREQGLGDLAEKYAAAGFAVLVFDYRYFGDSDGEPRRQRSNPSAQRTVMKRRVVVHLAHHQRWKPITSEEELSGPLKADKRLISQYSRLMTRRSQESNSWLY